MNCLDAETLAAWMDGGLTGAALADVQAHVAGCDRCQMLLGAMGRTRAAVPAAEPERAPRRWLAWAVPLTAAATAIAVWVAIPAQKRAAVPAPPSPVQEQAAAPAPPPPPATPPEPARRPLAQPPAPKAERSEDIAQLAPDAVITESAPPPATATAQSGVIAGQAAAAPRAAAAARDAAGFCGPVPPPGAEGQLTAGSPGAAGVCWLVGRGGLVLRSIDGRTWERINFPETTDLSSVRATDAQTVSISTADGRTFSTFNGGQTWAVR